MSLRQIPQRDQPPPHRRRLQLRTEVHHQKGHDRLHHGLSRGKRNALKRNRRNFLCVAPCDDLGLCHCNDVQVIRGENAERRNDEGNSA